jgi:hypothetical protein
MYNPIHKRTPLHCNTSLHFTTLHPTTLHYTYRHYTPSRLLIIIPIWTLHRTPRFTPLHCTTLHFTAESIRIHPFTSMQFLYRLTRLQTRTIKIKTEVFWLESKVGPSINFEITNQLFITYNHKCKMAIPDVLSTKHFNLHNLKTYGDKYFPPEDGHLIIKTCWEKVNSFIPYTQILLLGRWLVYNSSARQ